MRILHTVEFYHPSVGGAQEVVKQISEHLVERGHEVTVATTRLPNRDRPEINGVRVEGFDVAGNAVRGVAGETERYQQFLREGNFDVMMNYAAQQWATDLVFPVIGELGYAKALAPCGFSGLGDPVYSDYFAGLPAILRQYDGLIFHSGGYRDALFAREHGIEGAVIPNGASEVEFAEPNTSFRHRYGIVDDVPLLLTVGGHTGMKGHRLVIEAFRRARTDRAVLVIIGNWMGLRGCFLDCHWRGPRVGLFSVGRKKVLLINPPRADVVAAYEAADLFVFGSQVECSPLVLFEAMASRTAFVSVAAGNAEEIAGWGGGGVIVPSTAREDGTVTATPEAMAGAIEKLVADSSERERLAEAGYVAWRQRFTWDVIAGRYEELYRALIGSAAGESVSTEPIEGRHTEET